LKDFFQVPDNQYLHLDKVLSDTPVVTAPKPFKNLDKLLNSTHHLSDGATVDNESFSVTAPKPVLDFNVKLLNSTHHLFDGTTVDDESVSVTAPKPVLDFTKNIEENICEPIPGIFSILGSSVFDTFTDQYTIDPNSDVQIDPGSVLHINSSLWLFGSEIDASCLTDETMIGTTKLLSDTFVSITENILLGRDRFRSTSDTLDPVSDVSFLDIGKSVSDMLDPITADKDYFVIDKVLSDIPVVTDVKNYSIDKPLSDLVTADDTSAINTSKTFEDTMDPVTDASFLGIDKALSDTPVVTDATTIYKGKSLSDASVATDAKDYFVIDKALSDTPVVTDVKNYSIDKPVSDTLDPISDTIIISKGKTLNGASISPTADKDHFVIGKVLSDAPVVTDAKDHFVIDKVLSDVIYISSFINIDNREFAADSLNIMTDVQNYSFNKPLSDAAAVSDVQIFNINKPFADTLDPVSDVSSINTGKAFSNAVFLADSTNIFLNGSALSYKYDTQTVLDSGGALWKNAYLEDMSTFANDGADYMENKIVF
jgi:hypothetical protein